MVNEEILGGLRVAISHKSSLKNAMQSFYNAGYKKEEIEEAAKIVFAEQHGQKTQIPLENQIAQNKTTEKQDIGKNKSPAQKEKKLSRKMLIIILIAVLSILLIGLIALFLLR